jgi:hypothetical protein
LLTHYRGRNSTPGYHCAGKDIVDGRGQYCLTIGGLAIEQAVANAFLDRARWTVRLIVAEAVKRKLVPKVGRETIRMLLEHHDLKPWREKNVVRGGDR